LDENLSASFVYDFDRWYSLLGVVDYV